MLRETKTEYYHFFEDEKGHKQGVYKVTWSNGHLMVLGFCINDHFVGEYKSWHRNGQLETYCYYAHDMRHGEYREWRASGSLVKHCFYVNNKEVTFNEISYPKTPEELMLFKLKYDLQLLPVEQTC